MFYSRHIFLDMLQIVTLSHTEAHISRVENIFLCSLAYGFDTPYVQFHYCKLIMSLSKCILF
jgi:hypothetical protein